LDEKKQNFAELVRALRSQFQPTKLPLTFGQERGKSKKQKTSDPNLTLAVTSVIQPPGSSRAFGRTKEQ
jgi:hypothetical protein